MLEVRRVSKQFSGSLVVDDVSFLARPGEITGYLGPNGSGKSTTFKIVEGDTPTIPFTCSYLPGRSRIHIALVVIVLAVIPLAGGAAALERDALKDERLYAAMVAALALGWAVARWRTSWLAAASDGLPPFDAEPDDRPVTLELWDSRLGSHGRTAANDRT
jgi:hypothetical protein